MMLSKKRRKKLIRYIYIYIYIYIYEYLSTSKVESQKIEESEIQGRKEKIHSFNSRELSFSSKHANVAEKFTKWQQELEQSSQEIYKQCARLDEKKVKIQDQIKKLAKGRVSLDHRK
jgi:hypothetical protein